MEKWSRFFSKYLRFTRYFSGTYLRWRLQKIVSPGPQHVINQGNQLNQRLHLKKSSKSALKVAKKVTTFIPRNPPWKNSPICSIICISVGQVHIWTGEKMVHMQEQMSVWSTQQYHCYRDSPPSLWAHPRFGLGGAFISAHKPPRLHKWIICSANIWGASE